MRRALLLLLVACNSYAPDLGDTPFLCGTDPPRCPDGYTPVDVSPVRCECQRSAGVPDAGPAYDCNADPNEPNDSYRAPTATLVGTNLAQNFPNAAVCPADDVDVYALTTPRAGTLIKVAVTFDLARRAPTVDILDNAGGSVQPDVSSPQPGQVVATYTATYAGTHFAEISGVEEVNYSLRLSITPPP